MRDGCFKNQPIFIFRKSIKKKKLENLDEIFLIGKHPQNGEERKNSLMVDAVTPSRNGRNFILNENETLNPRAEN